MTAWSHLDEDFGDAGLNAGSEPRPAESIGRTLLAAFGGLRALPADMLGLLHRLDAAGQVEP